jgi:hypothetical protein
MLEEALLALASAGGVAVAQAAGTEVWTAVSRRVTRLLGPGDDVLAELDRTEGVVRNALPEEQDRVRDAQALVWETYFRQLLEALEGTERARTASALRELDKSSPSVIGNTFNHSQV